MAQIENLKEAVPTGSKSWRYALLEAASTREDSVLQVCVVYLSEPSVMHKMSMKGNGLETATDVLSFMAIGEKFLYFGRYIVFAVGLAPERCLEIQSKDPTQSYHATIFPDSTLI